MEKYPVFPQGNAPVPFSMLTPVNLILLFLRGAGISPYPSHLHRPFSYIATKAKGLGIIKTHGSLSCAEDVPAPPLEGESYF